MTPTFDVALFSKVLMAHLKLAKLTTRDAAERCGVSAATISRCSRGLAPDIDSLAGILAMLQLPFEFFVKEPSR